MSRLTMKILVGVLTLLGLALSAGGADALSKIERRGRTLAVRLCVQCHAIGKTDISRYVGAPPFRNLEQRTDLDTFARRLRQGLRGGHEDMPEYRFTREDAQAMVAYLRSIQNR